MREIDLLFVAAFVVIMIYPRSAPPDKWWRPFYVWGWVFVVVYVVWKVVQWVINVVLGAM
jgi:hypothetical protein